MQGPPPPRWLVYALGGGLGHATRACALARAAARRGHDVTVLVNSAMAAGLPLEPFLSAAGAARAVRIDPGAGRAAVIAEVARLLGALPWDVLAVDTFPRGLAGELPALLAGDPRPRVLVHRALAPAYLATLDLEATAAAYARILVPGEDAPLAGHPAAVRTAPFLTRDAAELLPPAEARARCGAREDRPLVLVSGAGRIEEVAEAGAWAAALAAALPAAQVRLAVPPGLPAPAAAGAGTIRHWPLLDLLRGADALVGAGGYNTVHEARATGTPLVAFARPRRYDPQAARLAPEEAVAGLDEAVERVRALLARPAQRAAPAYENGAHEAVAAVDALLGAAPATGSHRAG